jgi:hypothetical protein
LINRRLDAPPPAMHGLHAQPAPLMNKGLSFPALSS